MDTLVRIVTDPFVLFVVGVWFVCTIEEWRDRRAGRYPRKWD